ncbi:MAG: glycosyltransferase [Mediterranea massiliensis]|nr:glycosyltransferase [Mediterranea massiliensis]
MKVLIITDNYSLEKVGGKYYHRALDYHIKAYSYLGEIRLCLPLKHTISIKREINLNNINVSEIQKENTIIKRFIFNKNRHIIKHEVKNSDIIIGFSPSSVCDRAIKYAKKYDKTFVSVVISCVWDGLWNHSLRGKILAPYSFLKTRNTILKSDYAIYVTDKFLQQRYPCNGVSIGVSDVIIPSLDIKILNDRLDYYDSKLNFKNLRIATVAAVDVRYKGQEDVIKAMKILAEQGYNIQYVLIGGGDTSYLRNVAKKYGMINNLQFVGAIPHEKIFDMLKDIDIYIQPSKQEGLPRSVVEAMSQALPILCANTGGMPELVDATCIFNRGNILDIVKHIQKFASKDRLKVESVKNFENSKRFQENVLRKKRNDFLLQILRDYMAKNQK